MSALTSTRTVTRNIFKLRHAHISSTASTQEIKQYHARVLRQLSNEKWLLDNGKQATRAITCIVEPHESDSVIYCEIQGKGVITAIITRASSGLHASICIPQADDVTIGAKRLQIEAEECLDLMSAGDISVNAAFGQLVVTVKDLLQHIQHSFIQRCRELISRTESADYQASQMIKTHARHQILTADKDIRVDAERINMG